MCALYAFFRHTDDLVDESSSPARKAEGLDAWRLELGAVLAGGKWEWPGFPALADTVARYGIPENLLQDVIDGVAMDVHPRCFATFADLAEYCYHVASAVGLCCLHVWGYRSDGGKAEQLAERCGIALQLTNIIRDVHEDARGGRIYLPAEDLARFGVAPAELSGIGPPGEGLRALLAFQAQRAFQYYEHARPLELMVAPVGRAGAADDRRYLPGAARRDREPGLQRDGRSRVGGAVAKDVDRAASAGQPVCREWAWPEASRRNREQASESIAPPR